MIAYRRRDNKKLVLFKSGKSGMFTVYSYAGACLAGQATAYIIVNDSMVWVRPGESVEFVEVDD